MDDFEEALRNIDVFCKALVEKLVSDEDSTGAAIEPMEKLLYKKYVMDAQLEPTQQPRHLIPLPQLEEPLVDVFEEDNYVRVLMQCRCKEQKVTVQTSNDNLEICKRECHTNSDGVEICTDKCRRLDVPVKKLQVKDMTAKCSNNAVFEVSIPKTKTD